MPRRSDPLADCLQQIRDLKNRLMDVERPLKDRILEIEAHNVSLERRLTSSLRELVAYRRLWRALVDVEHERLAVSHE